MFMLQVIHFLLSNCELNTVKQHFEMYLCNCEMNNVRLQHYEISPRMPTRNISISCLMPYKKKLFMLKEKSLILSLLA